MTCPPWSLITTFSWPESHGWSQDSTPLSVNSTCPPGSRRPVSPALTCPDMESHVLQPIWPPKWRHGNNLLSFWPYCWDCFFIGWDLWLTNDVMATTYFRFDIVRNVFHWLRFVAHQWRHGGSWLYLFVILFGGVASFLLWINNHDHIYYCRTWNEFICIYCDLCCIEPVDMGDVRETWIIVVFIGSLIMNWNKDNASMELLKVVHVYLKY